MPLSAGDRLGRYEILGPLGAGGMGEVYRARDTELERDVAVKVLPEAVSQNPGRLERFRREAKAVAKLSHPNILEIWDYGSEGEITFSVTELLEGETLRERIPSGGVGWQRAAEIGAGVAEGLAAAHGKGVVHRDIKPENIFITADGRVKILDFGLARVQEQVPTEAETGTLTPAGTQAGTVMGTVGYMAPEQVRGQPADEKSDVFALGSVLHEMLTGKNPFARESTADTQAAILKEDPVSLVECGIAVPAELDRTVRRCLEKSPQARFQSASDLAYNLRSISTDHAVQVAAPTEAADARRRRAVWAVAVVSLAVVAALAILFGRGVFERPRTDAESRKIRSLAVLPLENLSADPDQEYFADGMTDALIATLAKIGALRVISRTSVMQYKDMRKPLPEIAHELNVDAVVEGTVLQSGSRVRITAQLIHAATDTHLWADSYERELSDVLTLQSEVVHAIAREIRIAVTPAEESRLASAGPVNPEAYQLYLRGRFELSKRSEEGFKRGLDFFQQAIEEDPDYALAYAGVADSYNMLASFESLSPEEAYPRAKVAAERALEIDETLGEAHTSLAWVRYDFEWDWSGAETEFKRAIALAPSHATAHLWYGWYLASLGRFEESLAEIRRAQQLDPHSLATNAALANVLLFARLCDQAIEQSRKTLAMDPNFAWAHNVLGRSCFCQGRQEEAITELHNAVILSGGSPVWLTDLGYYYAVTGRREEAMGVLERLQELSAEQRVSPLLMAIVLIGLDDKDQAFEWLEKAVRARAASMLWLKVEPFFDSLRGDPRYKDLLSRMNFPD